MSLNFTLYLSREFGYSDIEAGTWYGIWGVLISVWGFVSAPIIDRLGVRWSLIVGGIISSLGRGLFAFAGNRLMLGVSVFILMPLGGSLSIPVMSIGIKQVVPLYNRPVAYGLFYAAMNLSAIISGYLTDAFNRLVHVRHQDETIPGLIVTPLRFVFLAGTAVSIVYTCVTVFAFRDTSSSNPNGVRTPGEAPPATLTICQNVQSTAKSRIFWQLALFSALLTGVNLIFRHLDATFPKYVLRAVDAKAPYGALYSINATLIIFMAPLSQAILDRYDPYTCITIGSFISASSVFLLLFGPSYTSVVAFIVTLSVGEAIYSPRIYDYTLTLSPEGQEGMYGNMASAPMFMAKLFVGTLSGGLLQEFCPPMRPRQCWKMWLFIGLSSITSPILLFFLRPCIHTKKVQANIDQKRKAAIEMSTLSIEDFEPIESSIHDPENVDADISVW